jgi:hypothetical protein
MTQGVGNAKDLAAVQRGPEIYKAFTMFYTFFSGLFNQFAKAQHEVGMDKKYGKYLASLTLLWFLPAVLEDLVLGKAPDTDDDPEEWIKWLVKSELMYPAGTVILLRDVINGIEFDYRPSAAFDAWKSLSGVGKAAVKAVNDEEITRTDVKNMVHTVGYFAHLPTRQAWLTAEHLFDWMVGNTDDENPATMMWHTLVTGEPEDE